MAALTTNMSNVNISVSGSTTQTAAISWTKPTIPSGATISSCVLTGNASSFTTGNKGATLTINGTSVSGGSSFSINLGTNINTTSVTASFKGSHKQTNTSVTLSNLVYTVTYVLTYIVTFVDWDGTVLKTQTVNSGSSATAPTVPNRSGYDFIGWDTDFSNVTSNLTVTAQYEKLYVITFVDYDGTVLKIEEVRNGGSATAPSNPTRDGYDFIGWSVDFSNVASDITTIAQYTSLNILKIKDGGAWHNILRVYKKINNTWIEQINQNLVNLFSENIKYIKLDLPNCIAILYSDGTLVFSNNDTIDSNHGDVTEIYTDWEWTNTSTKPWYDNRRKIINVYCNDEIKVISTQSWFHSCQSLTSLDLSKLDTSNVTNMNAMFSNCWSLKSLNVSNFNTSNVTDMSNMFIGCELLPSLNVSSFDTSNVTDMGYMFGGCPELKSLDLSNFDTSNVTDMSGMFENCESLPSLDVSSFDTSNVTDMHSMFGWCYDLTSLDVSNFDTSNVTDMGDMFSSCSSLTSLDLSSFDMSKVTDTNDMFYNCTKLQTVYVKDQTAKTKIESSTNFPSTATVVIGSPNN